jgi:hypothetical protein
LVVSLSVRGPTPYCIRNLLAGWRIAVTHLCGIAVLSGVSHAQKTINVPADAPTIQGAINLASNGDTVLVAAGTYTENIDFKGKAITVTGAGGAAATILDGQTHAAVVTFSSSEGRSSVLSNFTMQNGAPTVVPEAGGIFVNSASPNAHGPCAVLLRYGNLRVRSHLQRLSGNVYHRRLRHRERGTDRAPGESPRHGRAIARVILAAVGIDVFVLRSSDPESVMTCPHAIASTRQFPRDWQTL